MPPSNKDYSDKPCILCDKYEQEICHILAELGELDEDYQYIRVNDTTLFRDFNLSPPELKAISVSLGASLLRSTSLVEVAEFLFKKKLDLLNGM